MKIRIIKTLPKAQFRMNEQGPAVWDKLPSTFPLNGANNTNQFMTIGNQPQQAPIGFDKAPRYVPKQTGDLTKDPLKINPIQKVDDQGNWKIKDNLFDRANKIGTMLGVGVMGADMATTFFDNKAKTRRTEAHMREMNLPENMYNDPTRYRGDWDQEGMFRPNELGFDSKGQYTNSFETGGETMNKIKIRIVGQQENMAYGGQHGFGLDLGQKKVYSDMNEGAYDNVSNSLQPVDRSEANIEAERGETVYGDMDGDGQLEHMKVAGKRHSEGGTPLNVPKGSFVFSDTKKMKIKDPEILKYFNSSSKPGGLTPAEIAKKYDLNKYKAILDDPYSDGLSKKTAQRMVESYNKKLGALSMIQESMKGFPNGAPQVAQQSGQVPEMEYGGALEEYQSKGQVTTNKVPSWFKYWTKAKTAGGDKSPAKGLSSVYNPSKGNAIYDDYSYWKEQAGRDFTGAKDYQKFVFGKLQEQNPDTYNKIMTDYGMTAAGKLDDGIFGARTGIASGSRLTTPAKPNTPSAAPGTKYKCTPNGVVAVPVTGASQYQVGLYNSFEEASAACEGKSAEQKQPITPNENKFNGNQEDAPFDFLTPDKVNMVVSAMNAPKKYLPRRKNVAFETGDVNFEDWRAKAAQRQANQYINPSEQLANYTNPQALASNMSFLAGQAAEGIGQDIAQVDSRNVDRANQFSAQETQRKDGYNMFNATAAQDYWRDLAVTNQQYDNSKRGYVNGMAKTFGKAWDNRMNMAAVNGTNPMFNIDPRSGKMYFKNGYNTGSFAQYNTGSDGSSAANMQQLEQRYLRERGQTGLTFDQWYRNFVSDSKKVNPMAAMQQQAARYNGFNPVQAQYADDSE